MNTKHVYCIMEQFAENAPFYLNTVSLSLAKAFDIACDLKGSAKCDGYPYYEVKIIIRDIIL